MLQVAAISCHVMEDCWISNEQPLQRSKVPRAITSILTTHCICTEAGSDSKRNQLAENIHLVSRSSCQTAQGLRDFYGKMLQATTASKILVALLHLTHPACCNDYCDVYLTQ